MHGTNDDARFWNRIARRYASDPVRDEKGLERTLAETGRLLIGRDKVLEIGCGTGSIALRLAPLVEHYAATDFSCEMIAIARKKASVQAIPNLEFSVAAAGALPGGDGTNDAVLAFNLFHLVTDRAAVWREIDRVLKPGGLLISKTPCIAEMNPMIRMAIPVMRLIGKAPDISTFRAGDLEEEIKAAGFNVIEQARHGSGRKDPRIFLVARKRDGDPANAGRGQVGNRAQAVA